MALNSYDEDDDLTPQTIQETNNGLDNVNNVSYPGIVWSAGCNTTPFDGEFFHPQSAVNLGMGWTTKTIAGGPAYLGNTRLGLEHACGDMFASFANTISFFNFLHLGEAESISKPTSQDGHYVCYSHNLVGCPETKIWTVTPVPFTNITVTENGNNINVVTGCSCWATVQSAMDNGTSFYESTIINFSKTFYNVVKPYLITIFDYNEHLPYLINPDNIYIQNETISSDKYIYGKYFYIGSNVTPSIPEGPVTIQSGSAVTLDADNDVIIQRNFEVETGALFEIK